MALALGPIASKCSDSTNDLTDADRVYLEEFRNANSNNLLQLSATNLNQDPYQNNFQQQKQQIIEQNLLLKRFRKKTKWKRVLIWSLVLTIMATIFIVIVFVFSRYVRPGHYVQYFTILFSMLSIVCLVVIGTHITRQFKRCHPNGNV